jgi:tRNA modification GTPase
MAEGLPPEVACAHLQEATLALEELLGVVEVEEVLDVLFSSFCVGK